MRSRSDLTKVSTLPVAFACAPCGAVLLREDDDGLVNAAAVRLLAGLDEDCIDHAGRLARDHPFTVVLRTAAAATKPGATSSVRLGHDASVELVVAQRDSHGTLLWLQRTSSQAALRPTVSNHPIRTLTDRLSLVARLGRVGQFERNLVTGEGHWDAMCCELFGIPPGQQALPVNEALQRVDPRDRQRVLDSMTTHRTSPSGTEFAVDYRVLQPQGGNRHVEVRGRVERNARDEPVIVAAVVDITAQQRTLEHLRESAQTFHLATHATGVAIWERDLQTHEQRWSPSLRALYGFDPDEAITLETWLAAVHPDDRSHARALYERRSQGDTGQFEYRIVRRDGQQRYLVSRAVIEAGPDGRPRRVIGITWDDTPRWDVQRQAHRLSETLQMATAAADIGVWEIDLLGGRTHWNAQMYAIHRRDPRSEPLDYQSWLATVLEEDRARAHANSRPLFQQGSEYDDNFRIRREDGTLAFIRASARAEVVGGKVLRVVGTYQDLSALYERAEAEQRLAQRLQMATETAHIGVWEMDFVNQCALWDAEVCRMLGVEPGPIVTDLHRFASMVHPQDVDTSCASAKFERELQDPAVNDGKMELRVIRTDGTERQIAVSYRIERDAAGRVKRVVGTDHDVTELRRTERELREANRLFEAAAQVTNLGVFQTDMQTGVARWDARHSSLYGFAAEPREVTNEAWLDLLVAEDRASAWDSIVRAAGQPGTQLVEYRVRHQDGSVRHMQVSFHVESRDGQPWRAVGTSLDVTRLRQAELAARSTADRLALANETGRIGVFERDAKDALVYVDSGYRALMGVGPAEPLPLLADIAARIDPADRPAFVAARDRMRAADAPVRYEYRYTAPDGDQRWMTSWRRRRLDAQGKYAGELGVVVDITDQHRAEERALALAERLALAQRSAGMGVWEWDIESGALHWDEGVRRNLDYPADAPADYATFRQMVHAEDLPRLEAAIAQAIEGREPFAAEFRVRTSSGEERVIGSRGQVHYGPDGRALRVVGIDWNATDTRATERAMLEASRRLALATQGVGIGVWERSDDRTDMLWDDQMYRLYGRAPGSARPLQIWQESVHPEDRPQIARRSESAAVDGAPYENLFRIRWPDGSERWIASRGMRRDHPTRPLIGINWDVTEARNIEDALRAKETAERANLAKSEFLSRMSHELRTPLNAIIGFTQLLELDPTEPPRPGQVDRLALIRNAGWHLLNLINDVLDLSRIETGRATVSMEVVPWREVVDESLSMIAPEAAPRGVLLRLLAAPDLPSTLWADRTRLRQVLLNLLSNAVKYNRPHGEVVVQVGTRDDGAITIAVRDTGPGLTSEQVARVFEPFNRLGRETSETKGTGIGLAISQRLVQQMDGAIEVDSTPGVGSTFRVTLRSAHTERRSRAQPPQAKAQPALAPRDDVRGTVLYIEDNAANSVLVEQLLQFRPQVKLYQAGDGATGLVMATVCQPDLILIDVRLPDMQGDAVLRKLRQQPETARVPCLAVSANAMPHDIQHALEAGFAQYWTKPIDAKRFLEGIDAYLAAGKCT